MVLDLVVVEIEVGIGAGAAADVLAAEIEMVVASLVVEAMDP